MFLCIRFLTEIVKSPFVILTSAYTSREANSNTHEMTFLPWNTFWEARTRNLRSKYVSNR